MNGEKYKLEWVRKWDKQTIISQAVSLGMQFQVRDISLKDLTYNKKILLKILNE